MAFCRIFVRPPARRVTNNVNRLNFSLFSGTLSEVLRFHEWKKKALVFRYRSFSHDIYNDFSYVSPSQLISPYKWKIARAMKILLLPSFIQPDNQFAFHLYTWSSAFKAHSAIFRLEFFFFFCFVCSLPVSVPCVFCRVESNSSFYGYELSAFCILYWWFYAYACEG